MSDVDDLKDKITENAGNPQTVTVDGQTVTQFPLSQQIDAHRYLSGVKASSSKRRGVYYSKIIPPGAR